ncbi:Hsp20/alpha crystallin family protein [Geobacter sulfurreducens]|jgi:HSP20 family protein|uniref:ATP-independent chaperone, alpha-crystallin/Hsp20 family n=1 Tax=Geobacter sulfurreducens (strain ATCC 51573 / DSM 12127 / PCA) TaxID=243231 RepID=Q74B03_GEOSL|nr:Hsp20/alpha crystallin family protein [Geobacter sulfurreducens]AAR35781.1 ATP-independent chaperone, alpha-crystallin/Hsp20 family [Geobacter sulfurreducens PCA]ADI85167.1 ATP-independent chaperone, alpha-crystallin/Hsp20 family [Geobacter sulfurreducens KN400]AJY68639.1 molecular chaperone [Geobacter sulfurreducens]QVW34246.1 Hsp20/alpha crystallin family protein [Geobacter sulfurreducens]UAC03113.1 Hsp20/alpha crystallin family protein [Geobacter sulfurreducens]
MSSLLPEKWGEALERVHDKVGHFLTRVMPWKKQEHFPERITADTLPAFMQSGGPLLDMHETADELIIRAEVPGLKNDDFSVGIVGRRLTIKGEKNIVRERKGGDGCLISECRYGSFARTLQLPYEIDEKAIAADLKHGVLTIRLPKPEKGRHARYRVPIS